MELVPVPKNRGIKTYSGSGSKAARFPGFKYIKGYYFAFGDTIFVQIYYTLKV
jgi:hypothetical protein